jgi:hypothetical protein
MTKHERLVIQATAAIAEVFSDVSVAPEETMDALIELRDDCDMKISCVKEDMKRAK